MTPTNEQVTQKELTTDEKIDVLITEIQELRDAFDELAQKFHEYTEKDDGFVRAFYGDN